MAKLIARYRNGGTQVRLYDDGTKIRRVSDPSEAPRLPEQMDLKITDWCDAGCAWCHEGSTRRGRHADAGQTLELLDGLFPGTEIAIGGGDPLSHPDFAELVRGLRAKGLVPSVTVNGRHLARHMNLLRKLTDEGSLFGVGVSFHEQLPAWNYRHLVVHMIAGVDDPAVLDGATRRKILVLGYKRHGRGVAWAQKDRAEQVEAGIRHWKRALYWLGPQHHLSFDTLAIEQLEPQRLFADPQTHARQFMGSEGQYSMYVDAVARECAVSSYATERAPWSTMPQMFAWVRKTAGHSGAKQPPALHSAAFGFAGRS